MQVNPDAASLSDESIVCLLSDKHIWLDQILRLSIHQLECVFNLVEALELVVEQLSGMYAVCLDHADESLDTACAARAESALERHVGHSETPQNKIGRAHV